jgi:hypothetical protein
MCFLQDRVEHWREIARRAVDDLQDISGCSLAGKRLVPLAGALSKLTFEIGDPLLGIG